MLFRKIEAAYNSKPTTGVLSKKFLKMHRLTLITFLVILSRPVAAQNCDCLSQFNFFEEKIRINYSGFRDKVTRQNQEQFNEHTAKYRSLAATAGSDTACFRIMSDWKKWFRDGHVQLSMSSSAAATPEEVRARFSGAEKISISEAEARNYFDQPGIHPAEGIWQSVEGNYRIALMRKPAAHRDFAAIILKADSVYWMPGQIKFELKSAQNPGTFSANYFMRDHSINPDTATLEGQTLKFGKTGGWYMVYPRTGEKPKSAEIFRLTSLDSSTALLVIPTMSETVRTQLDSLITANKALLNRKPNLIIDCRGNGGGSDITYRLVTPLLYTNRTYGYRNQTWATKDNADKYDQLSKNTDYPRGTRNYGARMYKKILRHQGKFIGRKGKVKNRKLTSQEYPKRVAVLIDGRCASSCESFVEEARQSKKVILIGVNTMGVSDYGNLHRIDLPCQKFSMAWPTTRSSAVAAGKGIDNVGFPPDVRLDAGTKDWVEFARVYLNQKSNLF